ncbi:Na+/H+ antiporter [Plantactinospora siamensis]|uniref:Na+/H+ antiporter n=1 Tax=Plantactinospora siamensis TaxID=555372 RepID=A0ABV6P0T4_9ACTN
MTHPGAVQGLVLVVVLATTVLVGTTIGGRYRVAPPVLLITMGALLAFTPPLSHVVLQPDVVLLLFLPAILYREALYVSLREVRANLLIIAGLAVALVILTTLTVTFTARAMGVDPAAAAVLGAVLSPTDAAAVAGLAKRLPRRFLTILRAESLINDGTALVLFSVAVGLIAGGASPGATGYLSRFAVSLFGGVAAGLVVSVVVVLVRRRLDDPLREGTLSVLTPFTAFLLAELVHASGVLAVVVAGLVLSYASPRVIRAPSRVLALSFWELSTFLINGGLFVLLGLQIPGTVRAVAGVSFGRALTLALVVAGVVVLTRLVWVHLSAYPIGLLSRGTQRPGWRARTAAGWVAFRGAVSLAAALAVPTTTASGQPVRDRELIIFVTAVVIISTMLVQGTTLPLVTSWAGLRGDRQRIEEVAAARTRAAEVVLATLPEVATETGAPAEAVERVRREYEKHLADGRSDGAESAEAAAEARDVDRRLRLAALDRKRREITRLRDANEIDDVVLRDLQAALDIEEIRLLGPQPEE